jgi:hypothetical protein
MTLQLRSLKASALLAQLSWCCVSRSRGGSKLCVRRRFSRRDVIRMAEDRRMSWRFSRRLGSIALVMIGIAGLKMSAE